MGLGVGVARHRAAGWIGFGYLCATVLSACGGSGPKNTMNGGNGGNGGGTIGVGGLFVALGVAANAIAILRYAAARRAIKQGREIPDDPFPTILAVLVTLFGTIIGAYLLRRLI